MVDCWTQWLLKPLHLTIFNHILVGIPQDGTMNQIGPILLLLKREPSSLFSLDLSAATDRLPLWLQKAVLAGMTGAEYAQNWAELLVNRDYSLQLTDKNTDLPVRYKLRYAVGQPMGAYSSWAMLAFVHHFIVQFCAMKAGVTKPGEWFTDYAIVGDDIVIGNAAVAKEYLRVMKTLGVGIGLHKSLISADGSALEFAKRTYWRGIDISPITFTELQAALTQPAAAVAFINKYKLTFSCFVKAAGYGYNVLGQLNKPLGKLNSKVRLLLLAMNMPVTPEDIERFFGLGAPKGGRSLYETQQVIDLLISSEFRKMKRALNELRQSLYTLERFHLRAKLIANEMLLRQGEGGMGMNYILPLVKEIQYQTMIHAKGVALVATEQISGQLTHLMLSRYDLSTAQAYEGMIALNKMLADLPIKSLGYERVFDVETRGLTDTLHIRMWKSLSGFIQGTKVVPKQDLGINMDYLGPQN
jgi:hypothetical protein